MGARLKVIKKPDLVKRFADLPQETGKAAALGAVLVRSEAIKSMRRSAGGRVYQIQNASGSYRTHQASAPGDPPAVDTGKLIRSIETEQDGASAAVIVRAPYAYLLEFGTRHIAPRPFLGPALEKLRKRIVALFVKATRDAGRGA